MGLFCLMPILGFPFFPSLGLCHSVYWAFIKAIGLYESHDAVYGRQGQDAGYNQSYHSETGIK